MTTAAAEPATRWDLVALGFLAGVVGMFQTAKMSVVLPQIQAEIGFSLVGASWSVTIVSLTGALFGVLAGRVTAEFGPVRTLVASLLLATAAGLLTAVAGSPASFLAARFLEGFGYLLACAAAPAMMAFAANGRDRGLAMAIWGAFVPVSVAIMSLAGPGIAEATGWRGLFLASAVSVAVVAGMVAAAGRDPAPLGRGIGRRMGAILVEAPAVHARLYRSPVALGTGVAFMAFAALQVGIIAMLPSYLASRGMSLAGAGVVLSAITPFAIAGTAVATLLVRLGAPDGPTLLAAMAAMGVTGAALFAVPATALPLILAGAALFTAGGVVASVIFAGVPKRGGGPEGVALLSGLIVQFGNIGSLTGAPLVAAFAEAWGWESAPVAVAALAAVGIAGVLMARRE